ncbi:MAG: hypothetical protein OEY11_04695 [Gammaproteobacteria bacterium]|nr:hypothetical protein [Gammaproteobacteria bacterium]
MVNTKNTFNRPMNLVIILAVCLILTVAFMALPKGFSDDLSKISQGSVVVVLTHDKNNAGGMLAMDLLNKLRADYEARVEFLAVDVNTAKAQAFMRGQGVGAVVLVVFDAAGSRQAVLSAAVSEKQLRSVLDGILSP